MPSKWEIAKEKASEDIIRAAIAEFAEKGYTGATTRSIAARAGVSNGLLGKYFESKENLLYVIVGRDTLDRIFDGIDESDPYEIFCIYIDYFRKQQKEDPLRFKIHSNLTHDLNTPVLIYENNRKQFSGSLMEKAISEAQGEGKLIEGDAYKIFTLFFKSLFLLFNQYSNIGADVPDNDTLLSLLGYKHKEIVFEEQKTRLSNREKDLQLLLAAVRETYPLSIFANLSQNNYHMIDYDNFTTRKAKSSGSYEELIAVGASTIPDEGDREKFSTLFNRDNLIKAYEDGEKERTLIHVQRGDDGVDRWMSTRCVLSKNSNDDIIALCISGDVDRDIKREFENTKIE